MNTLKLVIICSALMMSSGCARVTETVKVIWGSSTQALEDARPDAIGKTYSCSLDDCFDAVLALARNNKTDKASDKRHGTADGVELPMGKGAYDVFINDRNKRHIVVMGIEGNVNTTEVGIFFSQPSGTTVRLEVASLSSSAKRKVAQAVFDELDLRFSAVE